MTSLLALAVALGSPAFGHVRDCDGLPPLFWENALFRDPAEGLFVQERFQPQTEWTAGEGDVTGAQVVLDCFGASAPHSRDVVVHYYRPAALAPRWTRPVLLVTGAGDNALRSMSFLAVSLSRAGFHSYALTFAHRHGDNFLQAEQIANALQHIATRHPGVKIDVVAYSKGGVSARIYASNTADADWSGTHDAYEEHGTRYRGDVGRLIFLGAPNGGLDTPFRWPGSNLFSVGDDPLDSPTSWNAWYAAGTVNLLSRVDLAARSIYAEGGGAFVGQAQMLADLRDLHGIPGTNPLLGAYAVQPDYLTTYTGGLGFQSESRGIAQAIADGGDTIARLQATGVAPDVKLYLAAGGNPIMSVGGLNEGLLQSWWGDEDAASRRATWEGLVEDWLDEIFPWWGEAFADDLPRLFAGTAFLGEISGPSDGLLFVESAFDDSGLTLAGAEVVEARFFAGLNHAELVAAGQLAADFYGDRELAGGLYDERLAAKYARADNQSVEWVLDVLRQPVPERPPEPPAPDAGAPTADAGGDDAGAPVDAAPPEGDAGVRQDAAAPDDATAHADAGVARDAEVDPPSDATGGGGGTPPDAFVDASPEDTKGERFGGTCTAAPGAPAGRGPFWTLLLLVVGVGLRRRRR
ncbi:MAG: hypothetical protein H6704_27175 [Myxococcales bacterium]|nr:hypothetical protein [Myxococcales bacterium]